MKYILNQVLRNRNIAARALMLVVVTLFYAFVNNRIVICITEAVSDLGNNDHVFTFILLCIACTILETLMWRKNIMTYLLYTVLIDNLTDKVLDIDSSAFEEFSVSRITTMQSKVMIISKALATWIQLIIHVITILVILGTICYKEKNVAGVVLIVIVIMAMAIKKLNDKFNEIDGQKDEIARERNKELCEIIRGFKEVRFFNATERHRKSLHEANHKVYDLCDKREMYSCYMTFFGDSGFSILQIAGLIYGLMLIKDGTLANGVVISLIMFISRLAEPVFNTVFCFSDLSEVEAAVHEFVDFMNYENKIDNGNIKLNCFEDNIVFDNVSFEYDSSNTVLNGINLTIKRGEKVGICGESGGGKTTLLNLLMRSRDVNSGSISVDGIDIRKLDLNSYRHEIGIVSQDIYIFDSTIRNNIRYAVPSASDQDIIDACVKANLWDFIKKLPDGLDTQVGPEGLKLSGGQKQRISLARIFLKDPEIILLDEATSALDNVSERAVKKSLKLLDGKTIIAVAHRLTTIQNYDKIVVIGNHKILAEGTHDELLKSCEVYREMCKTEDNDE